MALPAGLVVLSAGTTGKPFWYTYQGSIGGAGTMANWLHAPAVFYGVPTGTTLTTLDSTTNPYPNNTFSSAVYTIKGNGTFTNMRFEYRVEVQSGIVNFVNCYFAGAPGSTASDVALLNVLTSGTGTATATHCTFNPMVAYDGHDCVRGNRFTLDGCELTRTVDGMQLWGVGNVTIMNSHLHDFIFYDNNSHPGSSETGTHNDGVQISSGSNYVFRNNLFEGTISNSGMYISQALGSTSKLTIDGNTFNVTGNAADINLYDGAGSGPMTELTIKNNIFKHDTSKYQMLISNRTKNDPSTVITGNVWADGSTPPPSVNGGA